MRVIGLCLLLFACSSPPLSPVTQLEKVGNHQGAIDHYLAALAQAPDEYPLYGPLAEHYFNLGDDESALFYAEQFINSGLPALDMYYLRGRIALRSGDYQAALNDFDRASLAGVNSGTLDIQRGIALTMLGDTAQATLATNQARLKGHSPLEVKNNLAVIAMAEGDYRHSIRLLRPMHQEYADNITVRINLGLSLLAVGEERQARELLGGEYHLALQQLQQHWLQGRGNESAQ